MRVTSLVLSRLVMVTLLGCSASPSSTGTNYGNGGTQGAFGGTNATGGAGNVGGTAGNNVGGMTSAGGNAATTGGSAGTGGTSAPMSSGATGGFIIDVATGGGSSVDLHTGGRTSGGGAAATGGAGASAAGGTASTGGSRTTTGGSGAASGATAATGGTAASTGGSVSATGGATSAGGGSANACGYMPVPNSSNTSNFDAGAWYTSWKSKFYTDCGNGMARVANGQGSGNTVSEGMGYGMLLAVGNNDKTAFDALWAFYKARFDHPHHETPIFAPLAPPL